jgi:predicted methyltransferase
VHEDFVKAMATAAGFEFVEASEINANPADTADHPFGVWTLPPVSATADREGKTVEGFDPEKYKAIGESDRMTLKFRKPE